MDKKTKYLLMMHKRQEGVKLSTAVVKKRKPVYKRNAKIQAMMLDENREELSNDRAYRGQAIQYSTAPDRMYRAPKVSTERLKKDTKERIRVQG